MHRILLLLLLWASHTHAQVTTIDSLKQDLAVATEDSMKFGALMDLSGAYRSVRIDSMVYYAQQGVLLSIKSKNSLPLRAEADALSNLAYALWYAGNYPGAKEAYLKALEKAEPIGDPLLTGSIYNGLALVNRNEGDFRQAVNYYTKAEVLTRNIPDNEVLLSALVDKGKAYEQLNILDSAFSYTQQSLALLLNKYYKQNVIGGGIQANMGIIYSKLGQQKLAEAYFRQSIQLSTEMKEYRLLGRAFVEFAEHFYRNHQRDSAVYYATKGLLMDEQYGFLVQQLAASVLLTNLYTQDNRIDSAFKYQSLMVLIRDSVFSREKTNRLQSLEFNEQLRQQEKQETEQRLGEQRAHNIQYAAIALGLIVFSTLFLLLSRSIIVTEKVIRFLGVVGLLIVFEFINLLLHPYVGHQTHDSPFWMLLIMVCIATLLVPAHHKLEYWITHKLVEKNNRIRLAAAKKTIEKLEGQGNNIPVEKSTNTQHRL